MVGDPDAKERVLKHIMTEIHHLPLPVRRRHTGLVVGGLLLAYAASLILMASVRGPVIALWQWLMGTVFVSAVEWAATSRWSGIDMILASAAVLAAAWITRTRGHTRG